MKWLLDNPALDLETIAAESRATLPLLSGRYEKVLEADSLPTRKSVHQNYYFWSGSSKYKSVVSQWERKLKRLNEYLELVNYEGHPMKFHSHQLRDTFAVEHLLHGTDLEDVSKLLGHSSITITEEYYAAWVPERRKQMEDRVVQAMRKMGVKVSLDPQPKKVKVTAAAD